MKLPVVQGNEFQFWKFLHWKVVSRQYSTSSAAGRLASCGDSCHEQSENHKGIYKTNTLHVKIQWTQSKVDIVQSGHTLFFEQNGLISVINYFYEADIYITLVLFFCTSGANFLQIPLHYI